MVISLIVCISIAVIAALALIIGVLIKIDAYGENELGNVFLLIGLVVLLLDAIFGFGITCGAGIEKYEYSILLPDEVAKSQYTLFVKCEGVQLTSTEARLFMVSNDVIRVKKTIGLNAYGGRPELPSYELVVMDGGK